MTSFAFGQPVGGICQISFFVADMRASVEKFTRSLNVGPWFCAEHVATAGTYRGRPSSLELSFAIGFAGHMQIELVAQHDDSPSVFLERDAQRRYGLHHQAVAVRDFDARLKTYTDAGYEIAAYSEFKGLGRGAYLDTQGELPFYVELLEMTDLAEQMLSTMHRASTSWDGIDPIRTFGSLHLMTEMGTRPGAKT